MNERILVAFERDGLPAHVTSARIDSANPLRTGVVLDGETSAWPRGLAMNLRPDDAATRVAFERVQRRLDWFSPRRFHLRPTKREDLLQLQGVDPHALPPGRYRFELRVGGLRLSPASERIRIPPDGAASVTLREKLSGNVLRLDRPVSDFDPESRRILESSDSRLDGKRASRWLADGLHRDRRKACLLNLFAKLAALPAPGRSLQRRIESVFFAEADRIYARVDERLRQDLRRSPIFGREPHVSKTHHKILARVPGSASDYKLESFREGARPSMQITLAVPRRQGAHYADIDVDLGNPRWDLVSFGIHIGELINPGKTNHLKLRRAIVRQTGSDFMYYKLERRGK